MQRKGALPDERQPGKADRPSDLVVLFTNTVSHKMVRCALEEAKRSNARVVRCHTSSKSALTDILEREVAAGESV